MHGTHVMALFIKRVYNLEKWTIEKELRNFCYSESVNNNFIPRIIK